MGKRNASRWIARLGGTAALLLALWAGLSQAVEADKSLPPYRKVSGISGNLSSVGSDTLNNMMAFWAEKFREYYPNVNIQIEGKGSGTAPPALIEATAQLGPMSRKMKSTEEDAFEKKFGYKPTAVRVAVDALAVFVNKDNPIECLSLAEVDAAFSKTRKRGRKPATTWGDLGLGGDWAGRRISLYGRNSASGTYGYFKKIALKKGDYRNDVKEQPGSASVVQGVTVDRYAIGYSGVGYATAGVRTVPLRAKAGGTCYAATAQNAYSGRYPLARFLYIYLNKAPGRGLDPLTGEFVKSVLSLQGQQIVVKDGYFPLSKAVVGQELAKL